MPDGDDLLGAWGYGPEDDFGYGDTAGVDFGDSPAASGSLPGGSASSGLDSWLNKLGEYGGKAVDAYKRYSDLQVARSGVDAARARAESANATQSRVIQFKGATEEARARQAALSAQQGLQSAAIFGSPLVVMVIVGAVLWVVSRQ